MKFITSFYDIWLANNLQTLTESADFKDALEKMKKMKKFSETDTITEILKRYKEIQSWRPQDLDLRTIETSRSELKDLIDKQLKINTEAIKELGIDFLEKLNRLILNIKEHVEKICSRAADIVGSRKILKGRTI